MINAIGLDAAREEEEDAIEENAPGQQEDHLLVSQSRISQNLQESPSTHSSEEESDTEHHMRATVADHSRGKFDC